MKTRLLVNSRSGRARRARRLESLPGLDIRWPRDPAEVTREARSAADEGLERLLVGGGDGTLHHAIRGLAGSACALGIVPLGTGNDLARALGVPLDPLLAVQRALVAAPRTIDLGAVDGCPFAGVAGLGFDGEVARYVDRHLRGAPRGPWIYAYAVVRTLASFDAPHVRVEHDTGSFDEPVMLVALANSPFFGGGMRIAPEAQLDDGWLDLILVRKISRLGLLLALHRVYRGTHLNHPAVRTLRVRRARLSARAGLSIYADGEPVAQSRAEGIQVSVLQGALRVLA